MSEGGRGRLISRQAVADRALVEAMTVGVVRVAVRVVAVLAVATALLPAMPRPAAAQVINFTAGELLGKPTDTSITVNVVPSQSATLRVQYGTSPGTYPNTSGTVAATGGQGAEVTVTGLTPDTRYYYRLQYDTGDGVWENRPEGTFHTQRAPGSDFTFVIQSDSHIVAGPDTSNALYTNTVANMVLDAPDFMIDLGDMFEVTSSAATVRTSNLTQRDFLAPLSANAAMFLAIGNHENEEGWWRLGPSPDTPITGINARKELWANPVPDGFYTGDTQDNSGLGVDGDGLRETYYAWEWGDALFVVIDPFWNTTSRPHSNENGSDPAQTPTTGDRWDWTLGFDQYSWLYQTLASSTTQYKFVFTHHLVGGATNYGRGGGTAVDAGFEWGAGASAFATNRPGWSHGSIHQMLIDHGVQAVFHGHDHCYATETRDGVVYQEVPMPNASSGEANFCSNYGTQIGNSGHVRVEVTPALATVGYIRSTFDVETNAVAQGVYGIGPSGLTNIAPTADAGGDVVVTDVDRNGTEPVQLDGSASSDLDGSVVAYRWLDGFDELATGPTPTMHLPLGVHEITLEVVDDAGSLGLDTITVEVNAPPTADAGADVLVVDADDDGVHEVALDASGSSDGDGSITSWVWTSGSTRLATGPRPSVSLGLGTHEIALEVTDDDGATDSETVVAKVISPPLMPVSGNGHLVVQARSGNFVEVDGFTAGTGNVTVGFLDPDGGPVCPAFATQNGGGNPGCDLQASWSTTATDTGGTAATMSISDVAIIELDAATDTATVVVDDPGQSLSFGCDGNVAIAYRADVDDGADATRMVMRRGESVVDFTRPGECEGRFDDAAADLVTGQLMYLTAWDDDGDRTLEVRPVEPRFECPREPTPFVDVDPNSFAVADIACIYGLGVTTGTSPSTYSPRDPVTREQMAAFLARLARLMGVDGPSASHPFTDVRPTSYAATDIALIYELGVTQGTGDGTTYSPDDLVTREQMASFLARLYSVTFGTPDSPVLALVADHPFTDMPATSFARYDVGRIFGLGITTGTSATTYSPYDPVTREQMAAFLARIIRVLELTQVGPS